jgi:hypothetical protein
MATQTTPVAQPLLRKITVPEAPLKPAPIGVTIHPSKASPEEHTVRTLVIDTLDRAYALCFDYVCQREGMTHPSEKEFGKGWAAVRKEWERVIQKLNLMSYALVFVCHEDLKPIKSKHREIDRYQPDLPKSGLEIVHDLSDIILHYAYRDDDSRQLFARPAEDRMCGCRGGMLPDVIEPTFKALDAALVTNTGKSYAQVKPTITIYGPPKIGKSTLASEFPNAIFADFENGLKWLNVNKTIIKSWSEGDSGFLTFCKGL